MKRILVTLLLLSLTACTTGPKDTTAKKIDPKKDYIYSQKKDDFHLKKILIDNNRKEDSYFLNDQSNKFESIYPFSNAFYDFEEIIININSDDAKKISDKFSKKTDGFEETRIQAKKDIESGKHVFNWASHTLLKTMETDDFISFISLTQSLVIPGHSQDSMEFITFDKKNRQVFDK